MKENRIKNLSRREREIMDIIYRLGEAGVSDVKKYMLDNPSYDTVRVLLGILAQKGHLVYRRESRRYIYRASVSKDKAGRKAIANLLKTFFSGAPSRAILTMLDELIDRLTEEELNEIIEKVNERKKR